MVDLVAQARAELARRQAVEAARAELSRRQGAQGPAIDAGVTQQQMAALTPAQEPVAAPEPIRDVVATTDDGGQVIRMSNGALTYTSPGYSTSDPDAIARIMEGATPVEIVQQSFDRQRIDANPGRAVLNEFARGVPFIGSHTDEIIGATNPQAGENLLALSGAMGRERPKTQLAANLTGAVAGAIPMAMAAGPSIVANAAPTLGGKALQGLALGAVAGGTEGAVYGAGLSGDEGPRDTRSGNSMANAAFGAGIGGVTGGVAPYVAAGGRQLLSIFRRADTSTIARELGVSREAATVIRNAIDAGDDDAAMAAIERGGQVAMLADATSGTRSLVDTAAQAPGNAGAVARRAVGERVSDATRQMTSALDDALGVPTGRNGLVSDIMQGSSQARQQAYDAAYAQPINYAAGSGRRIEAVLRRVDPTVMRQAVDEANAQMRDLGITNQQIRATIGEAGEVVFDNMPDVRQLDALKQALDSVAENSKNVQGIMSPQGRRAASQATALRNALGEAVPQYNEAVALGGQAIAERNAVDLGTRLLTGRVTREEAADAIRGMSQAELAATRQGVRTFIDDTTANIARTMTDDNVAAREGIRILRDLSGRGNREKMVRLIGRDQAEALLGQIDEAATGFELRAAIAQNSKTAARQMTDSAVQDQTSGGVVRTLMQGEPINATKRFVQALTGETAEAQTIRQMGLYQEIAETLVNTRGGRARRALGIIEDALNGQTITDRQAAYVGRTLSGLLASGAPVASREASNILATQ